MSEPDPSIVGELLRSSLGEGRSPSATVASDSMAPLLRTGDEVHVTQAAPERLKAGDILLLALPSDLLAHRFWRTLEQTGDSFLLTRGDRLDFFDPPYPYKYLVGLVITRRRSGNVLSLESGRGRWLNRWLAWLSGLEVRLLDLGSTDKARFDMSTRKSGKNVGNEKKVLFQVLRRLFYWAALIPTRVVDASNRPKHI